MEEKAKDIDSGNSKFKILSKLFHLHYSPIQELQSLVKKFNMTHNVSSDNISGRKKINMEKTFKIKGEDNMKLSNELLFNNN